MSENQPAKPNEPPGEPIQPIQSEQPVETAEEPVKKNPNAWRAVFAAAMLSMAGTVAYRLLANNGYLPPELGKIEGQVAATTAVRSGELRVYPQCRFSTVDKVVLAEDVLWFTMTLTGGGRPSVRIRLDDNDLARLLAVKSFCVVGEDGKVLRVKCDGSPKK